MNELQELNNYKEYKEALDKQMIEASEGFVRIGYLLKLAKDTDILKESGYSNVNDFAKAEYGIDKTMVSRFININDRFSENGNSPFLKASYQGFGYAKLAIMLQLPDTLNEELNPDFSKREIQALKEEIDEEKKISDLEVYAESLVSSEKTELEQVVLKICEENAETYLRIHKAITTDEGIDDTNIIELFAPAGEMIYSIRIPGIGRIAVTFKEGENKISLINLRTSQKKFYSLDDLVTAVIKTIDTPQEDGKIAWQQLYGIPFPVKEEKKAEVAPVQQKKPAPKKESKVVKAKIDEKTDEKPINPPSEEKTEEAEQTQLNDLYPEIPEVEENSTEPEESEPQIREEDSLNDYEVEGQAEITDYLELVPEEKTAYLRQLDRQINDLEATVKNESFRQALICAQSIVNILNEIIEQGDKQC